MSRCFVLALAIGLGGFSLLYVWGKVDVVRVGYEIEELSKRKTALQRKQENLQVKLSQLTALGRIASEARDKLNMQPPEPGQIIIVTLTPLDPSRPFEESEPIRLVQGAEQHQ